MSTFEQTVQEIFLIHHLSGDLKIEKIVPREYNIFYQDTKIAYVKLFCHYPHLSYKPHGINLPSKSMLFDYEVKICRTKEELREQLQYLYDNLTELTNLLRRKQQYAH